VKIIETDDVEEIRPLYAVWMSQANGDEFGIDIDAVELERDFQSVVNCDNGAVFLAYDDSGNTVGVYSQMIVKSGFSRQMMAVGTHWFALPSSQSAGIRLVAMAETRALRHGCSHVVISASRFSSDVHDKVCRYCERIGAKPFETFFIKEI